VLYDTKHTIPPVEELKFYILWGVVVLKTLLYTIHQIGASLMQAYYLLVIVPWYAILPFFIGVFNYTHTGDGKGVFLHRYFVTTRCGVNVIVVFLDKGDSVNMG